MPKRWSQEEITQVKKLYAIETPEAIAQQLGITADVVYGLKRRYFPNVKGVGRFNKAIEEGALIPDESWLHKILKKPRKTPITLIEISNQMDCSPKHAQGLLSSLRAKGHDVLIDDSPDTGVALRRSAPTAERIERYFKAGKTYRFGAIADPHLCSKFSMLEVIETVAQRFRKESLDAVYVGGNLMDGQGSYSGHEWELTVTGCDAQVQYAVENWPDFGCEQLVLASSTCHEGGFYKREGLEQVKLICDQRPDMTYLGMDAADIIVGDKKNKIKIRLIHPGAGSSYAMCFDDKTEILTKEYGWLPFSELCYDDEVATMTKEDHTFEWQKPDSIIDEYYDGEMIHFKSRVFDFVVTPNHRLWTRFDPSYKRSIKPQEMPQKAHYTYITNWHDKTAQEIFDEYKRQKFAIPTVCSHWEGTLRPFIEIPRLEPVNPKNKRNAGQMQHLGRQRVENIAELIAWYVTEGHISKNLKQLTICQSQKVNPENHKQITDLLERLGLRFSVKGLDNKDIGVGSIELNKYLFWQCGHGSAHKYLPLWLKEQPKEILRIVFDTMVKGDGWDAKTGHGYSSRSEILSDDLSEIAQKLGYGTTTSLSTYQCDQGERTLYSTSIRKTQNTPTITNRPTKINYKGTIHCCKVENGLIYVRRNGKAFWSHNSYKPQKIVESMSGGQKPNILLVGHFHKMGNFMVRNVDVYMLGCLQAQSPFMQKRHLAAHVGAWIIEVKFVENSLIETNATKLMFYEEGEGLRANEDGSLGRFEIERGIES